MLNQLMMAALKASDYPFEYSDRPDQHGTDLRLVQPQPQQRIVQFPKRPQRPRLVAGGHEVLRGGGLRCVGRGNRQLARAFGAIDILVVNTPGGVAGLKSTEETDNQEWEVAIKSKFLTALAFCQAVLPEMRKRVGRKYRRIPIA